MRFCGDNEVYYYIEPFNKMTHYKKHWLLLLATRLLNGKRVVIKKDLYAQFLVYAIQSEFLGGFFMIETTKIGDMIKIIPGK